MFQYFHEVAKILNDYVDHFVIVEGNKTWQNNYKNLKFNIDKFF